jgi:hypothetical protein
MNRLAMAWSVTSFDALALSLARLSGLGSHCYLSECSLPLSTGTR